MRFDAQTIPTLHNVVHNNRRAINAMQPYVAQHAYSLPIRNATGYVLVIEMEHTMTYRIERQHVAGNWSIAAIAWTLEDAQKHKEWLEAAHHNETFRIKEAA